MKDELKNYTVLMTLARPAWNERDGVAFAVPAAESKSDAIKQARKLAEAAGYDRQSGPRWFRVTESF